MGRCLQTIPVGCSAQNATNYTLDGNGNVTGVSTAGVYNATSFAYDRNGNLIQENDALNNLTTFSYDEGGRLTQKTNPNSTTVSTGYDFYRNLNKLQLSGGQSYDFGFDLEGQRKSSIVYNPTGQKTHEFSYSYDEVGNLLSTVEKNGSGIVIGEFAKPTGNTMYSHINLIQGFDLKYGGTTTTYHFTYTKGGLIKTVSAAGKTYSFEYDENNNLISRAYANSTQDIYTYNEANQVVKTQTLNSGNQPKWSSKYSYDKDGRLKGILGSGAGNPTATYVYNDTSVGEKLNRLTKATINDGSGDKAFNYRYDPAGNLLAMTTPEGELTFSYDNPNGTKNDNRIYSLNGDSSAISYDTNGNLTKLTLNGTTYLYGYDAMNRLITVNDGDTTYSYTYDGDGNRLTKTVNGVTTTYHYFQGELQYETVSSDPAGVIRARYTRTPGGLLLGVKLYNPGNGTYADYYYHYNAHGDVIAVTDQSQNVFRQYVYDPYGNIISVKNESEDIVDINNDSGFNHAYTYAGYRYDQESGLYFLNARYYHAGIGQFLTKDTLKGAFYDTMSLNRYAYAGGDPVNYVDPSGHRYVESWYYGRDQGREDPEIKSTPFKFPYSVNPTPSTTVNTSRNNNSNVDMLDEMTLIGAVGAVTLDNSFSELPNVALKLGKSANVIGPTAIGLFGFNLIQDNKYGEHRGLAMAYTAIGFVGVSLIVGTLVFFNAPALIVTGVGLTASFIGDLLVNSAKKRKFGY